MYCTNTRASRPHRRSLRTGTAGFDAARGNRERRGRGRESVYLCEEHIAFSSHSRTPHSPYTGSSHAPTPPRASPLIKYDERLGFSALSPPEDPDRYPLDSSQGCTAISWPLGPGLAIYGGFKFHMLRSAAGPLDLHQERAAEQDKEKEKNARGHRRARKRYDARNYEIAGGVQIGLQFANLRLQVKVSAVIEAEVGSLIKQLLKVSKIRNHDGIVPSTLPWTPASVLNPLKWSKTGMVVGTFFIVQYYLRVLHVPPLRVCLVPVAPIHSFRSPPFRIPPIPLPS